MTTAHRPDTSGIRLSNQAAAGPGPDPVAPADRAALAARIDAVLPQTQCTRCGYPDCASYAEAIAGDKAGINQCPPGGYEGIVRLAAVTGRPVVPLDRAHGAEAPRTLAYIDENWCIGCTLCIKACPVDAIVGASKHMHTVLEDYCTGCELCIPVCPVDCILTETVSASATGWQAWSSEQATTARLRYGAHNARTKAQHNATTPAAPAPSPAKHPAPPHMVAHRGTAHGAPSQESETAVTSRPVVSASESAGTDAARKAAIAAALAKARSQRTAGA